MRRHLRKYFHLINAGKIAAQIPKSLALIRVDEKRQYSFETTYLGVETATSADLIQFLLIYILS